MAQKLLNLIFIFLLVTVSSCSKNNHIFNSPTYVPSIEGLFRLPEDPPVPDPGMASISGVLYTLTGKGVIPETAFYLIRVDEINPRLPMILTGPRVGDPQGRSDAYGIIVLRNVPPGSYYLAVWAPYNWVIAIESGNNRVPRLIVIKPNQRLNLGIIYLQWP